MVAPLLILLCATWVTVYAPEGRNRNYPCPTTRCTSNGPQIRFPFRLNTQRTACGLPGPWFDLSCSDNMTLLHLQPPPLEVYVVGIDYMSGTLEVNDAGGCFEGLAFNLNLSASPFKYNYYIGPDGRPVSSDGEITFLDCSTIKRIGIVKQMN